MSTAPSLDVSVSTASKMSAPSTKQKVLSLIEDVEIVTKTIIDVINTPKQQRVEDTDELIELFVQKDKEIRDVLKTAKEQGELQKKLDSLKDEVGERDLKIKNLQKSLKDAESILATAIYQAKQKLNTINQANSRKISSEELIKYAHMISSTNAVAAPESWVPGDPRRPYPTDMDMLRSELAKFGTTGIPTAQSLGDGMPAPRAPGLDRSLSSQSTSSLSWQPGVDHFSSSSSQSQGQLNTGQSHMTSQGLASSHMPSGISSKDHEDAEIMSSDSSSSSSSDE